MTIYNSIIYIIYYHILLYVLLFCNNNQWVGNKNGKLKIDYRNKLKNSSTKYIHEVKNEKKKYIIVEKVKTNKLINVSH